MQAAVRYIETASAGQGRHFYAPLCSVDAKGEMALKSRDTEQQITLTAEIQEPTDGCPALVINGEAA